MAILKQELTTRGVQGGIPAPNDDTVVQALDPMVLLEIQAVFGNLIQTNPRLVALCNNLAPVLFATLLFTAMEEYGVTDDGEVAPTKDLFEAEAAAIGMIRSVASAMGMLYGDVAVDPSDTEIDQDTDIMPI